MSTTNPDRSPLASKDEEFLDSEEAGPLRILAEYMQPMRVLANEGVVGTIADVKCWRDTFDLKIFVFARHVVQDCPGGAKAGGEASHHSGLLSAKQLAATEASA